MNDAKVLSVEYVGAHFKQVEIMLPEGKHLVLLPIGGKPEVWKPDCSALRRNSKLAKDLIKLAQSAR